MNAALTRRGGRAKCASCEVQLDCRYVYVVSVYIPILEALMLVQFLLYTPHTRRKAAACALLCLAMAANTAAQLLFDVHEPLQWASIAFWAVDYLPQASRGGARSTRNVEWMATAAAAAAAGLAQHAPPLHARP